MPSEPSHLDSGGGSSRTVRRGSRLGAAVATRRSAPILADEASTTHRQVGWQPRSAMQRLDTIDTGPLLGEGAA